MAKKKLRIVGASATTLALVASLAPLGGVAFAAEGTTNANAAFWTAPTTATEVSDNLLTTYGVRAGSAGGDFVGLTNVNFDTYSAGASAQKQAALSDLTSFQSAGLAIWGSSVNENPNPYYWNLMVAGKSGTEEADGITKATTWSTNGTNNTGSSWGDSDGIASYEGNKQEGAEVANGLEYSPDIIFGANKYGNWNNMDSGTTQTLFYQYADASDWSYNPTFANNDSTNLWTQVYTINQLAATANSVSARTGKTLRYDATSSALAYEQSLRGNLLYIASQIDANPSIKKTVAYLYAIDKNGDAYFFVPEASGLTSNSDTGKSDDQGYAGNNGTIDLDYMDTLPFITNTFDGGSEAESTNLYMKVEDIVKNNPGVIVKSTDTDALNGVDVVIYNTSTSAPSATFDQAQTDKLSAKASALSYSTVENWVAAHNTGDSAKTIDIIQGDDWATSKNQGWNNTAYMTEDGMSPMLYCMRNYTTDKPSRAVWAFSQVYSDLYLTQDDAYAYWVDTVYHVDGNTNVAAVTKYMTNQTDEVVYTNDTIAAMQNRFQIGLDWWENTGSKSEEWSQFAYYNGSSRASYYDNNKASEEPTNLIGIMQPTQTWLDAAATAETDKTELNTVIAADSNDLANVTISKDGTDVTKNMSWTTQEDANAYAAAIEAAQKVADTKYITQDAVNEALAALNAASATFDSTVQNGKMTSAFMRLAGDTEYGTMKQIVESTWKSSDVAILATHDVYQDALVASGLAGQSKCPILMTGKDSLDETTANLIKSLGVKKVIVMGGTASLPDAVLAQLPEGVTYTRLAGDDAAGTARKAYEAGKDWGNVAIIATAGGFEDALSASPIAYANAYPIFLAGEWVSDNAFKLDDETLALIKKAGFDQVVIVGGTASVSADVETQLADAGCTIHRLGGADAIETSNIIANYGVTQCGMNADGFGVASSGNYYDALTAGAMLGINNSPLLLVDNNNATSGVGNFLTTWKYDISYGYVFGGEASVIPNVVLNMDKALS